MAYSKKRYKSRREKYEKTKRNTKVILIFVAIALFVLIIKNRTQIYDWIRYQFY